MLAIWCLRIFVNSCALPSADEENAGLLDSFNSFACHTVACLPNVFNSNACSTVIEDSVNPNACPTRVDEEMQRFELSQLLSLDVLPFLKHLFHKFVIPNDSEISDDLCLTHVVAMFEQL